MIDIPLLILNCEDRRLYETIDRKLSIYKRAFRRTLHGVTIKVPPKYREGLSLRPDQSHYHYNAKQEHLAGAIHNLVGDVHVLKLMAIQIEDHELSETVIKVLRDFEEELLAWQ